LYLGEGIRDVCGAGDGDTLPAESFELVEEDSGDGGNRLDSPDEDEDVADVERVDVG